MSELVTALLLSTFPSCALEIFVHPRVGHMWKTRRAVRKKDNTGYSHFESLWSLRQWWRIHQHPLLCDEDGRHPSSTAVVPATSRQHLQTPLFTDPGLNAASWNTGSTIFPCTIHPTKQTSGATQVSKNHHSDHT